MNLSTDLYVCDNLICVKIHVYNLYFHHFPTFINKKKRNIPYIVFDSWSFGDRKKTRWRNYSLKNYSFTTGASMSILGCYCCHVWKLKYHHRHKYFHHFQSWYHDKNIVELYLISKLLHSWTSYFSFLINWRERKSMCSWCTRMRYHTVSLWTSF